MENYKDKIKIIDLKTNSGSVAKVRNIGLDAASGEYVTFLDSDDWYAKNAVKIIYDCLEKYNPDALRFEYERIYENEFCDFDADFCLNPKFYKKTDFKAEVYPKFIEGISLNSVCLSVFKRDILKDLKFREDFLTAEDLAFCIEAYTRAKSALFIENRFYCYFQSGNGLTGSGLGILKKYKYNFKISKIILNYLKIWQMNTLKWQIKSAMRPIKITFDKIKRNLV